MEAIKDNNCFICKIMQVLYDQSDALRWVFASNETTTEKAKLASMLTGIDFDEETIELLQEHSVNQLLLSAD